MRLPPRQLSGKAQAGAQCQAGTARLNPCSSPSEGLLCLLQRVPRQGHPIPLPSLQLGTGTGAVAEVAPSTLHAVFLLHPMSRMGEEALLPSASPSVRLHVCLLERTMWQGQNKGTGSELLEEWV